MFPSIHADLRFRRASRSRVHVFLLSTTSKRSLIFKALTRAEGEYDKCLIAAKHTLHCRLVEEFFCDRWMVSRQLSAPRQGCQTTTSVQFTLSPHFVNCMLLSQPWTSSASWRKLQQNLPLAYFATAPECPAAWTKQVSTVSVENSPLRLGAHRIGSSQVGFFLVLFFIQTAPPCGNLLSAYCDLVLLLWKKKSSYSVQHCHV